MNSSEAIKVGSNLGTRTIVVSTFQLVLVTLFTLSLGLPRGGRWDLYQPLAMADRGLSYWTTEDPMLIGPSTPYPPLTTILIQIAQTFGQLPEEFFLIFAALLTAFVPLLLAITAIQVGSAVKFEVHLTVYSFVSILFLYPWVWYSAEGKPDTLALVLFLIGLNFAFSRNQLLNLGSVVPVFLAILAKQQIIAPVAALIFGLALKEFIERGRLSKSKSFIGVTVGAGLAAVTLLTNQGFLDFGVLAHVGRGLVLGFDEGHLRIMPVGLGASYCAVLFGIRAWRQKPRVTLSKKEIFWLCAVAWLAAGVFGWLNYGGNSGNLAVGLVLVTLFLVELAPGVWKWRLWLGLTIQTAYLVFTFFNNSVLEKYQVRIQETEQVTKGISGLEGRIALRSDDYLSVRDSMLEITDLYTWEHVRSGYLADKVPESFEELLEKTSTAFLLCKDSCSPFAEQVREASENGSLERIGQYGAFTLYKFTRPRTFE